MALVLCFKESRGGGGEKLSTNHSKFWTGVTKGKVERYSHEKYLLEGIRYWQKIPL